MEESLSGKKPIATKEQISELFGQLQPVYMLHEKVIWGLLKEGDLENFGEFSRTKKRRDFSSVNAGFLLWKSTIIHSIF